MPTAIYYRAFVNRLAHLADARNPAHICVTAAGLMVRELSPVNPRRELVQRLLREADPFELARHKLRDLYDRTDPTVPAPEETPVSAPVQGPIARSKKRSKRKTIPCKSQENTQPRNHLVFFSQESTNPQLPPCPTGFRV